jgi:predicted DNA-binding transcriptional regulator AlpA
MEEKLEAVLQELQEIREALEQITDDKPILTLEETAEFLGIGMNTMYSLKEYPGFPVKLCGPRVYRVPKRALLRWMAENEEVYRGKQAI